LGKGVEGLAAHIQGVKDIKYRKHPSQHLAEDHPHIPAPLSLFPKLDGLLEIMCSACSIEASSY